VKGSLQGAVQTKTAILSWTYLQTDYLLFSYVGYRTQEIPMQKGAPVTIHLAPAADTTGEWW